MSKKEVRAWYAANLKSVDSYASRATIKKWARYAMTMAGPKGRLPA